MVKRYRGQNLVLDMESPEQKDCDNMKQRRQQRDFYLRNGFRETQLYRRYEDIEMTIMMIGDREFSMKDWDDITTDQLQHWNWNEE